LLEAFRDTLHVGYVGQFSLILALRHQIIEFACYVRFQFLPPASKDALPTGKSLSSDKGKRTELLRHLPGARAVGNGRVDLSAGIDVGEIRALVLLLKRQTKNTN
jgi:hypothetical protein